MLDNSVLEPTKIIFGRPRQRFEQVLKMAMT